MLKSTLIYLGAIGSLITIYFFVGEIGKDIFSYLIIFAFGVYFGNMLNHKTEAEEKELFISIGRGILDGFGGFIVLIGFVLLFIYRTLAYLIVYCFPIILIISVGFWIGWGTLVETIETDSGNGAYMVPFVFVGTIILAGYYFLLYEYYDEIIEFVFEWTEI